MNSHFFVRLLPLVTGLIIVTFLPSGCAQGPDTISEKIIIKEVSTQMKASGCDRFLCPVILGRYEEPDTLERIRLRKLAVAGLITYKVERYAWWERLTITKTKVDRADFLTRYIVNSIFDSSWDGKSYRKVKAYQPHFVSKYIVNVALTEKGKKLVTELELKDNSGDDYDDNLEDPAQYPWNQQDLSENWPVLENPFDEKKGTPNVSTATKANVKKPEKPAPQEKIPRIDSLQYKAYIHFKETEEKQEVVCLKGFKLKTVKASNIQLYEDSGFRKAKAEVELILKDVTDAGRIYFEDFGAMEGAGRTVTAVMDYYVDKGWKVDYESLEEQVKAFFYLTPDENIE